MYVLLMPSFHVDSRHSVFFFVCTLQVLSSSYVVIICIALFSCRLLGVCAKLTILILVLSSFY